MIASSRRPRIMLSGWRPGWRELFLALVVLSVAGFLFAPWPVEAKSIAVLHGICAQRPSHSFWFGAERLPFDARMTGIYGGFLITQCYLLARGRFRATGIPSLPVLSALILFVIVMGVDGLNSTFDDMALLTVYQPSNPLRYATGALTGTTLAVFLWLLTSSLLWRADRQRPAPVVRHIGELFVIGVALAGFGWLAMSGWQPIYRPLSFFLVAAAILAMFQLSIAFLQLARRRENTAASLTDLAGVATGALLCAYGFLFFVSGSRFLMEMTLHVKELT
ncbi:MAG TPA: DUF2085 domain-containing protein [Nitrolancea sp.]|jgi:uncharacterized membrane protein|nr:DUF2085 domain-containing protein [Nitrolancea sp.]